MNAEREQVLAKYSAAINKIGGGRRDMHNANLACLKHIADHNDWTVAQQGIDSILESEYRLNEDARTCVDWFVKYAGMQIGEVEVDGKTKKALVGRDKSVDIRKNFAEAKKHPYYEGIKKTDPFEFDLNAKLGTLLGQAKRAVKRGDKEPEATVDIDPDQLAALEAAYRSAA